VDRVLRIRIGLLYGAMQKLGYEKEDAKNEIRRNLKEYVPSLDADGVTAYEEQIKMLDMFQYKKQSPEKLTDEQRNCIGQLLKDKHMNEKHYYKYGQCIG
ncbi:MAG: hypothetical protein ACHQVS_03605, partial [Candidatus Babeliales bacterium]